MKSLHTLYLAGSQVTGVGLKGLAGLQTLDLGGTQATDAGLKGLGRVD